MKMMIERIKKINETAAESLEKAKGMLEMFNDIYGTQYGFSAARVVRFDDPDGSVAERYAHTHDVEFELRIEDAEDDDAIAGPRFAVGEIVKINVDGKDNPSIRALEHNGEIVTIKEIYCGMYKIEELSGYWSEGCFSRV